MRNYLILIPIFLLALFQGVFLPYNLVLLSVLVWSAIRPPKESLLISFLAGLFLDLALGGVLGLSSLVFLAAGCLLLLYRLKLNPFNRVFLPPFVFISANTYSFFVNHFVDWREGTVLAFLAFLLAMISKRFFPRFDQRSIRLRI